MAIIIMRKVYGMEKIVALSRLNRWWQTGITNKAFLYKTVRSEFDEILASINSERIISIIGPRRVGKSTLIYQTVDYLIKNGTNPKRILFFSGDDPSLFSDKCTIGDILEIYVNEVLHENIAETNEKIYVFIDEIHVISDWQLWLKSYYDQKYSVKFIVSGSSSTHLFLGAKESLLGRIVSINIMPLTFLEFCNFWAVYKNDVKIASFLKELPDGSVFEDLQTYFDNLKKTQWKLEDYKPYVNAALKEYLLAGGYPEYFIAPNDTFWQKQLVGDIIGQGLYRDIVSIYNIKNPERLEKLLYFIAANNGQDFNFKTIADTIGCDNETVSNYISFLSQAYLAIALENYSPNIGKTIRKNKTLYILDNGIGNALLHLDTIDSTREGHLVENLCVRDALSSCQKNFWKLFYWREGGLEVDLVIDKKTDLFPIEVKYRNAPQQVENMKGFMKKFSKDQATIKNGLFITKDYLGKTDNIFFVPFWLMK